VNCVPGGNENEKVPGKKSNSQKSKRGKTWNRWLVLFFPAAGLPVRRKIIAVRKELLAVKMRGGWKPVS
jgi:hypothetical protein